MTPLAVSIAGAIASFMLVLVVLELIRSRRLRERYALLWLVTGIALTVLSAWRDGLNTIAGWLGVRSYPPAVLFAVGLLFVLAVLLALLDGDLAALRPERAACAAARAARGAERARGRLDDLGLAHGLDDLVDEVDRALLRLVEDPRHVLPDHAEAQELDAAEEQHDGDHRRPALRVVRGEEAHVHGPAEDADAEENERKADRASRA